MDITPQSIREVRFRQALRGYSPEDVDAFITRTVAAVEELQARVAAAEARAAEAEGRSHEVSDAEESLRRTLVLAQRTADMAVREAQEEAARLVAEATAEREAIEAEVGDLRSRLVAEAQQEVAAERERLHAERDALQRDVAALQAYLAQERERLRIYFNEQLRRVDEGVPGVVAAPPMEAGHRSGEPGQVDSSDDASPSDGGAAVDAGATPADDAGHDEQVEREQGDEDDPFLAELRRAVTDTEPLGPRDEEAETPPTTTDEPHDIFDDGDSGGRFLRRRR